MQWACPGLTLLPLCPHQLALDIDRDTEDQNRYLDGMVRVSPALCRWAALGAGGPTCVTGPCSPLRARTL